MGAVNVKYSARVQIDGVYSHECTDPENSGAEYPFDIQFASTEIYLLNSISITCGKGMTARSGGAGSVVAYNYMDQTYYMKAVISPGWVETTVNGCHAVNAHHILFEGNWGANIDCDNTHGPAIYHTYLRNWATGLRSRFTDPADSVIVDDANDLPGSNGPYRAVGPMGYQYWHAYVGNVLGTSGQTTTANGWIYQTSSFTRKTIWLLGWTGLGGGSVVDSNLSAGNYIFRHGNYDYVNGSVQWDPNTPNHSLPNSFYLNSAPAFFSVGASCTYPWPWVTPTGASQIQNNSCAGSGLPALARFVAGTPFVQP
jgi:hypothetical protein